MSVHIDIAGLRREQVAVVPSPLAELGMALHALSEPGHHPGLQGWVTGVTARLDPHLADRMCEADFLWRTTFSDLFMPFAGIPGRSTLPGATLADELDLLDKLTDEQFVDAALEFTCSLPYCSHGPDALSDAEVRRRALDLAAARGPRQLRFSERLLADRPGSGRGCGSSCRTVTRRSSRRPGRGCATSSRRTPGTRRTCSGTRAWPRCWPRCPRR